MAEKIFKGFKQVTEGSFEAEAGYIYFIRNSANTGKTDGYIQFNGRKYGTAADVAADLNGKIGTLPEGYNDIASYIKDQVSAITENYVKNETFNTLNGRVDTLEAISADTRLGTIEADYLKAENLTGITKDIEGLGGRVDALETIDAGTRLGVLEDEFEALSAETRLTALESSAHTHDNKAVLDGITQDKVNQWDGMSSGAKVVLSAYTGGDAGVTEGSLKSYEIFQGGVSVGKIDIPKDLVVSSGQIVEVEGVKYLRLTIANSSTPVDIAVTDLVDVYTPGNGIEISGSNEVSAKVVSANGLSVSENGIEMALADRSNNGAMSSADFDKLASIAASAQTNVIETVKVDGTPLTVTDKAVDIKLPDYSSTYAPLSLTGTVNDNKTAFDSYTAATDQRLSGNEQAYNRYTAATDERLGNIETSATTWNNVAGSADTRISALEAVSAGTRLDTLEAVSAGTRLDTLEAVSAGTRLDTLEAVSADTRLNALEALTGATSSALQSISAGDASVNVGTKSGNDQSVAVAISSVANNALKLESDGLFAAIYYDGDDSN